jgi:hypothetical protein
MVVGCQPYAPAAFTPRNIPGTHFHYGLSRTLGHGLVGRKYVIGKNPVTTPGIDPGTVRIVAQRPANPGPVLFTASKQNSFGAKTSAASGTMVNRLKTI